MLYKYLKTKCLQTSKFTFKKTYSMTKLTIKVMVAAPSHAPASTKVAKVPQGLHNTIFTVKSIE